MNILLGSHEAGELLGLTRQALHRRRMQDDFPEPIAELRCGPIWTREQLAGYAKDRSARYHERPAVEALANEDEEYVTIDRAAELLGVTPYQVLDLATTYPTMPKRIDLRTGQIRGIPRDGLGVYARALGVRYLNAVVA